MPRQNLTKTKYLSPSPRFRPASRAAVRFFRTAVILLAIVFTAQACNRQQAPRIELTWWKPFVELNQVQPLLEEFRKTHPNVLITLTTKSVETYEEELIDALASGSGPDIFAIHNDWLPKHKDKLVPAPATIFGFREYKESFVEVVSRDLTLDENIYAVPLDIDVLALYYNKDILAANGIARPPASWEELVAMTAKLTRQDKFGNFERSAIALGTADNINRAPDILGLLMLQNGVVFYSPDRKFSTFDQTLRDDAGTQFNPAETALEFYTQFANPAKVTYTWNNKSNNSIEAFASGQVAMIISYAYLKDNLRERAPFLNYGVSTVPQIDPAKNKVNFANYWAEGVSKQSKNQAAAWEFLKFVSQKEPLKKYYAVKSQPAPRIDIIEEQIADPEIGVFAENALSAKSLYKPDSRAVEGILVQMIGDVVLRNIAPKEALSAANQKINLLLRNF